MNFLGFLAPLLGIIMEWIYKLIPSYGWTLIIFTLLTKILMFPLSVKQQKSTARMSAYQPMMQEIQKKWANDKNRQQEELMKFQQETGMSMTAGCLPMAVNFLVLFGLIEVVYRPLQYILRVPKELIDKAVELANSALGMNLMANNFTVQNDIINAVKSSPDVFSSVFSADQIASISDFNFMFLGIDLSRVPHFAFDAASLMLMIIPILSVVTMILSHEDERTGDAGRHEVDALDHEPDVRVLWLYGAGRLLSVLHRFQRCDARTVHYPEENVRP